MSAGRVDREPQPGDGPDYWADHAAWVARNKDQPRRIVSHLNVELAEDVRQEIALIARHLERYPEGR